MQQNSDRVTLRNVPNFYSAPEHQAFTLGESKRHALLVHGFPGTPAELRPLASFLAEAGWQVRAPLLPGFGSSIETLGQKRWQDWTHAVESEFRTLAAGAEHTLLLGFSMGGAIALVAATNVKPDTLVLLAPFWRFDDWRVNLLPVFKHFVRTLKPFENADFSDPQTRETFKEIAPDADLSDPDTQAQLKKSVALPTEAIDQLRQLGRRAYALAPRVSAPCLVIQGEGDTTVRPEHTRKLVERIDRAQLVEVSGGHSFVGTGQRGHKELLETLQNLSV
ncbi:alpha/beta fold hydrolase [soil metagenome]